MFSNEIQEKEWQETLAKLNSLESTVQRLTHLSKTNSPLEAEVSRTAERGLIQSQLYEELVHSTDHRINENSADINLVAEACAAIQSWLNVSDKDLGLTREYHNKDLERAMKDMATHGLGVTRISLDEMFDRSMPEGVITHPQAAEMEMKEDGAAYGTRMRRFQLIRNVDMTGVSGTGCVAEGVEFADGSCALSWLAGNTSLGIYPNVKAVENIHGHGGNTIVVYLD